MSDPVIAPFKQEFDRFHEYLRQLIDACPNEAVWLEKNGSIAYWQHLMHTFACMEYYTLPVGAPRKQTRYPEDVVRFKAEPDSPMTQDEVRSLAKDMHILVHEYMARQNAQTLTQINESVLQILGRECSNLQALITLVRHATYHLGCCDAILRSHGLPGVH